MTHAALGTQLYTWNWVWLVRVDFERFPHFKEKIVDRIVSQAIPFAARKGLVTLQPLSCHQGMQSSNIPVR